MLDDISISHVAGHRWKLFVEERRLVKGRGAKKGPRGKYFKVQMIGNKKSLTAPKKKKKNQSTSSNKRLEKIKQTKTMPLFPLELKFIFVPHGTILRDSFLCCLI